MHLRSSSALAAAESAFALLTSQPAPLAMDTRPLAGLPDRTMPLDEVRALALTGGLSTETTDGLWQQLARQARQWGPAWVVGAVGVALPGLTRMASRLTRGHRGDADDVDAEVLTGFLQALREAPLEPPRLWLRLCWAAWRAGLRIVRQTEYLELPAEVPTGSRTPARPYGHPDLILGRAAAAGIITADQAELISATRFGGALIDQLAADGGVSAPVLRMRRRRAELRVAAAILAGDLSSTVPVHRPATAAPPDALSEAALSGSTRRYRPRWIPLMTADQPASATRGW